MKLLSFIAFACFSSVTIATPVFPSVPQALPRAQPVQPLQARQNTSEPPCAQASHAVYNGTDRKIPAKLAFDCLNSAPLNVTAAKYLVKSLPPFFGWQSTISTLKNPPAEYVSKVQPPTDILGGLDKIIADLDAGRFESEYDFGWTLYTLILSAHDGHLNLIPDSVGSVFRWGRPIPLVSVSKDGLQLPSVFTFDDVLGMQFKNISYTPSPVEEINGMSATDFLEDLGQLGSLQDRDALYNNLFYELAQVSLGGNGAGTGVFSGGGRGRFIYPGATTTLKFANGTKYTMENYGELVGSLRNIRTGEDLAKRVFGFNPDAVVKTFKEEENQIATNAAAPKPGYPIPVLDGYTSYIDGFYIDGAGYEDVAVLRVAAFAASSGSAIGFQKTSRAFFAKALADGKTKLIIDLQANGGGTILQGYDLFKQLFPDVEPYGANRWHATESIDLIGQSFSGFASQLPRVHTTNSTIINVQASWFDYHMDMDVNGEPFTSWQDKYGPVKTNGDEYSHIGRWNLSDVHIVYNSGGTNITGYGPLANITGPPKFKPENIVLVTDGYCASTCTIFTEFMTKQVGVKTIAMGGRSNNQQIQAVGGVKGVNVYSYSYIQSLAYDAIRLAPADQKDKYNTSVLSGDHYSGYPYLRSSASPSVNNRDGLALNDSSGIALQFIYEEADCRLYYTPEMTVDITAVWKAASDARWGYGKCVSDGGYGKKRATHEVTRELTKRSTQLSKAAAQRQVEAFEKSFSLETRCGLHGDGFMRP